MTDTPDKKGSIKQQLSKLIPANEVPGLEALEAAEKALAQRRVEQAEAEKAKAKKAKKAKGKKSEEAEELPRSPRTTATKRGYLSSRNKRAVDREQLISQRAEELMDIAEAGDRPIGLAHAEELAEAWLDREVAQFDDGGEYYVKRWHEMAPTSRAVKTEKRKKDPLMFAIRNLSEILSFQEWWIFQMVGRPGFGMLQFASMLLLAFGSKSKDLTTVLEFFDGKNSSFAWSYGNPAVPGKRDEHGTLTGNPSNVVRQGIRRRMESDKGPEAIRRGHGMLLAIFRRLASLRGPDDKLLHPDAGKCLVADAQWIPTDEPQRYLTDREKGARINRRRWKSAYRSYKTRFDRFLKPGEKPHDSKKSVRGYLMVSLLDLATGVSLAVRLVPADDYEPRIVFDMWLDLVEAWKDIPTEFIIGDGLYSHPRWLPRKLLNEYGVVLISPPRKDWKNGRAFSATLGTPCCDDECSRKDTDGNPLPMKFKDISGGIMLRPARLEKGIPDGVVPKGTTSGHLRYVCPVREKYKKTHPSRGCDPKYVYPHHDPQLYSVYPHMGFHRRVADRQVMLARRNSIESMHSVMKELGWGRFRLKFGGDAEHELILTLAHVMLAAKRLVHENGDYDRAVALWAKLGLNRAADGIEPGLAMDAEEVARLTKEFQRESAKSGMTVLDGENRRGYHRDDPPPTGSLFREDEQRRAELCPRPQAA